jgi:hypothetical protein
VSGPLCIWQAALVMEMKAKTFGFMDRVPRAMHRPGIVAGKGRFRAM